MQDKTPTFAENETGLPFAPPYESNGEPVAINTIEWKHLCAARFGKARSTGHGKTRWTGDSYRYDIFERFDIIDRRQLAMRWENGSGQGWLLTEDRAGADEANMLDLIVAVEDEARRWDYCHFLWSTARKSAALAAHETERELKQAFVEGRLKKRKARGEDRYTVTVEYKP